jgi:hypothetical protein
MSINKNKIIHSVLFIRKKRDARRLSIQAKQDLREMVIHLKESGKAVDHNS